MADDASFWNARWAAVIPRIRLDDWDCHLRPLGFVGVIGLIAPLRRRGARSALFAGCGLDQTPKAFAFAGFESVGLDFSSVAVDFARRVRLSDEQFRLFFQRSLAGDRAGGDFSGEHARVGGSWRYEVGDFLDASVEPGPFDFVTAIGSLQGDRARTAGHVVDALDARVAPGGLLHVLVQNEGDQYSRYRAMFVERGYVADDVAAPGKVLLIGVASG